MSKTVDERVVSMRFDNENFEKNAQQSLSTLEKLKNSLSFKGASDGLKNVDAAARSVNMSGLESGVKAVETRFSALQVIGVTALARITNQAMAAGEQLIKSLSTDQITAGWTKYADKTTAVQTIMAATASAFSDTETQMAAVNEQLEKLSWFTDETSYNFVDMVSNIGKFTSNNIGLEESVTAMQGIANWAAISGANATEASRAMYNLSQAIGVGAVTAVDWRSIENANMATAEFKQTAIETAAALGKLKKTGDGLYETMEGNEVSVSNFREALKDKWFDNSVLTQTLDKYGAFTNKLNAAYEETGKLTSDLLNDIKAYKDGTLDIDKAIEDTGVTAERYGQIMAELGDKSMEFGMKTFKAAQETKTFAEVIDYTKDAVSSNWMNIFESIFGDYTNAKKFWTGMSEDFYTLFVQPLEELGEVVEEAFGSKWTTLTDKINKAGISVDAFESSIRDVAGTKYVDRMIEKYGSLEQAISAGAFAQHNILQKALERIIGPAQKAGATVEKVTQSVINLEDVVRRVIRGDFGNGQARVEALTKAGYDYYVVQDMVNKTIWGQAVNYEILSEAQLKANGYTEEQIALMKEMVDENGHLNEEMLELIELSQRKSGRELFTESIQNGLQIIIRSIGIVRESWNNVFNRDRASAIYNMLDKIHSFSENVLGGLDKNADKITRTFTGLFNVLDLIIRAIKAPFRLAVKLANKVLARFDMNVWDVAAAIGDWLTNLHDVILGNKEASGVLETIIDCLARAIGSVVEFVRKFGLMDKISSAMSKIGEVAGKTCETMSGFFDTIGGKIKDFIERWKGIDHLDAETVKAMLKDLKENFIDPIFDFSEAEKNLDSFSKKVSNYFGEMFTGTAGKGIKDIPIVQDIMAVFSGIGQYLSDNVDFGDVITGAIAGIDIYAVLKIVKLLGSVSDLAGTVEKLVKSVTGTFTAITKYFKGLYRSVNAKIILNIAFAIGILAASLAALAYLANDPRFDFDAALDMIQRLAIILGGLALAVGVMNKLSAGVDGGIGVGAIVVGLAASLWIVTKALQNLENLKVAKVEKNLHALQSMLYSLAAVVIAVIAVSAAIKKAGIDGKLKVGGAMFGILAMAGALYIIVLALIKVQNELSGFKFMDFGEAFLAIFTMLASVSLAAIPFAFGGAGAGFGLLAAVGALVLLLKAIDMISEFDTTKITNNLQAFIAIFIMLRILMGMTKHAGENGSKGGAGVLQMAAALLIIVIAMKQLADMSPEDLKKSLAVVSILMAIMGGVMALTHYAGENAVKAGISLILMSVAIGIIVGIMYLLALLAKNNPAEFNRALGAVTIIGTIFAAIIYATKGADTGKNALKTIAIMLVVIVALAGILLALSKFGDPSAVMNAALALAVVTGVFAVLLLVAKFANITPGAMTAITSMVFVVAGLAVVLALLAELAPESVLQVSEALSLLLLSFSAALVILSFVGGVAAQALVGIGVLIAAIVLIGGLMAAIGALMSNEGSRLEEFVTRAIPLLQKIGLGIGAFIGGIIGGIGISMMMSFKKMGEIFEDAMLAWQPGLNAVKSIDTEVLSGAKSFAEMLLILGGANIVDSIASFLGFGKSMFSSFGNSMKDFAESLSDFPVVKGADVLNATRAAEAGKAMAEVASSIPRSGGTFQTLFGEKNLSKFASQIRTLGAGVAMFPEISDDDATNSKRAAELAGEFVSIAGSIPAANGVLQTIFGGQDLGTFGFQIRTLADNLQNFPEITENDKTYVLLAAQLGAELNELASSIPKSGGLWQDIFGGEQDLGDFGNKISAFATAISTMPPLAYTTTTTFSALAGCVRSSVAIANLLTDSKDSIKTARDSWLFDDSETGLIGKFSRIATKFGEIEGSISEIDFEAVNSAIDQIKGVINALVDVVSSATAADSEYLTSLTDSFRTFAQNGVAALGEGFTTDTGVVTTAIQTLLATCTKTIAGKEDQFKKAGNKLVAKIHDGADGYSVSQFTAPFTRKLSAAVASINTYYTSFYKAGIYLMEGYINGMTFKERDVYKKAESIGKGSYDHLMTGQMASSPSKLTFKAGEYFMQGYMNGMLSYASAAQNVAESISSDTVSTLATTLSSIDDIVNSNLDLEPTITPVIDSSSLAYGMDSINSMFSDTKASVLSADISGRIDANSIVLDYIDKLDKANSDRNNVLTRSLDSVRNEIGRLGDRIDQIDMVLDSGELVGAIGSKVDRDLGRRTKFKNRGM